MAHPKVSKALEEARKLVADLEAYEDNPISHQAVIKQTDRVRTALEEPIDLITRMFELLSLGGAVHIILGIRAYHAMPEDGSSITADELARITNVASTVIHRAYRVAVNHGVFTETAPDTYAHNDLSRALNPKGLGSFFMITLEFTRAWIHLPDYLKSHEPDDVFELVKSPAVYSVGKEHLGKSYYELLEIDPDVERREVWNTNMFMVDQLMPVVGMFPFASLKEEVEQDPERPFLVDIGAGRGQSCFAIRNDINGAFNAKFILQDLPGVIDNLKPEDYPGFELMTYDAFTPQPVKNAHIYFMRRFLHDFYTPVCIEFVKNTASAMGPDSRLIICDMLVPDMVEVHENMDLYWLDMALLCMTGQEKKKEAFEEIFDAAGLELVKIYPSAYGRTVMLEAKLKKSPE
ncbi:S-adenosyl-L-methionine-dependent methyltransferase [Thelonectria olida]|uniref:S-adenosyl-L-methionine-dependent methyltransferase n=1 Tax=Thelonectria olida TaxID=1576542 RepID=A0A9P9AQT2_9HYPO|nr:S-adenosyl-L-methionine-dependent methyltransferase [Thelonectria olida]